ncbi:MAG: hypothetical protein M0R51_08090 [Clostridia bacterium]|jgi:hypothetical protein|nr:hypothetical protein [Clostridia bacterium]
MMKKLELIKGIMFVLVGIVFLFVSFWSISLDVVTPSGIEHTLDSDGFIVFYWWQIFQPTIWNWILSILFVGIGTIEIIKGVKK